METRNVYEIRYSYITTIEDEKLLQLLLKHSEEAIKRNEEQIRTVLQKMKEHFLSKGYEENELIGEVKFRYTLYVDSYELNIVTRVKHRFHDVELFDELKEVIHNDYTSPEYIKEKNELGMEIKDRLKTVLRIRELERENQELKGVIERQKREIEDLNNEKNKLEEELVKCREEIERITKEHREEIEERERLLDEYEERLEECEKKDEDEEEDEGEDP